jgi:transketolase
VQTSSRVVALTNIATRLRIDSVRATTEAGSGHPTTCCSAAEIMAALFFAEMRYDPRDPQNPDSDRFASGMPRRFTPHGPGRVSARTC